MSFHLVQQKVQSVRPDAFFSGLKNKLWNNFITLKIMLNLCGCLKCTAKWVLKVLILIKASKFVCICTELEDGLWIWGWKLGLSLYKSFQTQLETCELFLLRNSSRKSSFLLTWNLRKNQDLLLELPNCLSQTSDMELPVNFLILYYDFISLTNTHTPSR